MKVSGHMYGGSGVYRRYMVGVTVADAGIVVKAGASNANTGLIPSTSTDFADAIGIAQETAVADLSLPDPTGLVTVDIRPDAIVQARLSGSGTEGVAMTILVQDTASDKTLTDSGVTGNDPISGIIWRYPGRGMEAGDEDWRTIDTWNTGADILISADFPTTMAVGEQFLMSPMNHMPLIDTSANDAGIAITTTTLFTEANGDAVAGATGGAIHCVNHGMRDELSSYVEFLLSDHEYAQTIS